MAAGSIRKIGCPVYFMSCGPAVGCKKISLPLNVDQVVEWEILCKTCFSKNYLGFPLLSTIEKKSKKIRLCISKKFCDESSKHDGNLLSFSTCTFSGFIAFNCSDICDKTFVWLIFMKLIYCLGVILG